MFVLFVVICCGSSSLRVGCLCCRCVVFLVCVLGGRCLTLLFGVFCCCLVLFGVGVSRRCVLFVCFCLCSLFCVACFVVVRCGCADVLYVSLFVVVVCFRCVLRLVVHIDCLSLVSLWVFVGVVFSCCCLLCVGSSLLLFVVVFDARWRDCLWCAVGLVVVRRSCSNVVCVVLLLVVVAVCRCACLLLCVVEVCSC